MAAAEYAAGCPQNVPVAESEPRTMPVEGALAGRQEVRILAITSTEDDGAAFAQMLDEMPFRLTTAHTCREAAVFLNNEQFGIVLCDCSLADGTWIDILNQ